MRVSPEKTKGYNRAMCSFIHPFFNNDNASEIVSQFLFTHLKRFCKM